ncbi:hypothetical protein, partial [Corynebacterium sanguinis]
SRGIPRPIRGLLVNQAPAHKESDTLLHDHFQRVWRSVRRVPILPPDRIRTLPFGTGVTLLRSAPPIITDLTAWPTRPDAEALKRGRARLEQLLQNPRA